MLHLYQNMMNIELIDEVQTDVSLDSLISFLCFFTKPPRAHVSVSLYIVSVSTWPPLF